MRHVHTLPLALAIVLGLGVGLGLGACGKDKAKATPGADLSVDELTKIKAECDACEDRACAEVIDRRMEAMLAGVSDAKSLGTEQLALATDIARCVTSFGID